MFSKTNSSLGINQNQNSIRKDGQFNYNNNFTNLEMNIKNDNNIIKNNLETV